MLEIFVQSTSSHNHLLYSCQLQAEKLLRRALAIEETHLGPTDPQVAVTLHELGVAVCGAGGTEEAADLLQRALGIEEGHLGTDNVRVASTRRDLGVCLTRAGRIKEASRADSVRVRGRRGRKVIKNMSRCHDVTRAIFMRAELENMGFLLPIHSHVLSSCVLLGLSERSSHLQTACVLLNFFCVTHVLFGVFCGGDEGRGG